MRISLHRAGKGKWYQGWYFVIGYSGFIGGLIWKYIVLPKMLKK